MRYVVIGASAAGISGAKTLRELDKEAEIILVSKDENVYSRCILHHYISNHRDVDALNFTFEEMNLMCIYNTGSRTGLIDSLREMRGELSPEETELRELTDSALCKLQTMTDDEFAELELYPDFDQ